VSALVVIDMSANPTSTDGDASPQGREAKIKNDSEQTIEKVERTDVGVLVSCKLKRGTGTRDQDEIRAKVKAETVVVCRESDGHVRHRQPLGFQRPCDPVGGTGESDIDQHDSTVSLDGRGMDRTLTVLEFVVQCQVVDAVRECHVRRYGRSALVCHLPVTGASSTTASEDGHF